MDLLRPTKEQKDLAAAESLVVEQRLPRSQEIHKFNTRAQIKIKGFRFYKLLLVSWVLLNEQEENLKETEKQR